VIELSPQRLAELAGAEILAEGSDAPPRRAVADSRLVESGDLFVGFAGERADGGEFAAAALEAGAWGVIVEPARAAALVAAQEGDGWILAAVDPLAALQSLAGGWRATLGCPVVGITGSTGKTSVKDICRAILGERVHASPENYNTEIGLPLALLMAPAGSELLVLEMAMRGAGQIAELCAIARPDVAVITNVGPVHLELLGTIEAIAAAKAEIVEALEETGTAVVPAGEALLAPHLERHGTRTISFGPDGDVRVVDARTEAGRTEALIATPAGEQRFELPFDEAHNLTNALAAIATGVALGIDPVAMSGRTPQITFSPLRGERIELDRGVMLINDCYNANPMSMRAALDHLAAVEAERRIAVLGEMAELGPGAAGFHHQVGEHARAAGIDVVLGVGAAASDYAPDELAEDPAAAAARLEELIRPGDAILVKGSRSAGLEAVAAALSGAGD
jgi:UDP-N-acetylmuramoyl-tripeptide--D-alanyl-D-alanine ligase